MEVTLTIPGQPVAKGRPRMTRTGRTYTPAKTRQYEAAVKALALHDIGAVLFDGPLEVHVMASFRIPKSWPKSRQEAAWEGRLQHIGRPDGDNVAKAVLDALEGVLFENDSQICRLRVDKLYSTAPCVTVIVKQLEDV